MERSARSPLYADLGLGAKDYEHGIGRGIWNGSLTAFRRSMGPRPGETNGERASGTTTKLLSRWSGGYRDKYGCTWLWCWWRVLGDGAPRDGLDCLDAYTGVVWRVGWFGLRSRRSLQPIIWVPITLYSLQSFRFYWSSWFSWCPSLFCPTPPSPFPRTTILVPIPS